MYFNPFVKSTGYVFALFFIAVFGNCCMMPMMSGSMMCHGSHSGHEAQSAAKTDKQTVSDSTQSKEKTIYYTGPMHSQIHETKPGNCPICGMNLVPE